MTDLIQKTPYSPPKTAFEQKNCTTCNARIHRQIEICPHCGVRQLASPPKMENVVINKMADVVIKQNFELANRWTRLDAVIHDIFVMIFITIPFSFLAGLWILSSGAARTGNSDAVTLLTVICIGVIIPNMVPLCLYGQNFGKRMYSMKIVKADGSSAGLGTLLVRTLVTLGILLLAANLITTGLPFPSSPPLIIMGTLIALLDPLFIFQKSRQCLHDMIANTIVVKVFPGNPKISFSDSVF